MSRPFLLEESFKVQTLLDSNRKYRHHDENIFTVQFSDVNTPFSIGNVENPSPFTRRKLQITQNL